MSLRFWDYISFMSALSDIGWQSVGMLHAALPQEGGPGLGSLLWVGEGANCGTSHGL